MTQEIWKKPGRKKKKPIKLSVKQANFLDARHKGATLTEAKKLAGYTKESRPELSKAVKASMAEWQDEMRRKFMDDADSMHQNMLDLAKNAESEGVRFNATKDILDRAGLNPITKNQNETAKFVSIESRISREVLNRYEKEAQKGDGE